MMEDIYFGGGGAVDISFPSWVGHAFDFVGVAVGGFVTSRTKSPQLGAYAGFTASKVDDAVAAGIAMDVRIAREHEELGIPYVVPLP